MRLCKQNIDFPSDISLDGKGNIWILSAFNSKISMVNSSCDSLLNFTPKHLPLKIQVNSFDEVIVLTGEGDSLFEVYNSRGQFLRGFGQRIQYGDPITDSELSDGRLVADKSGGIYFSFNYPPLIRHYARNGKLLSEFKPESDVKILPPNITVERKGKSMTVSSQYQILVLDMAVDASNRLYLLISGENRFQALTNGSRKLRVVTESGVLIQETPLDQRFHRVTTDGKRLYLLNNRKSLCLQEFRIHG